MVEILKQMPIAHRAKLIRDFVHSGHHILLTVTPAISVEIFQLNPHYIIENALRIVKGKM